MKLIYLSHWRFPSEKTMTPLILKTCAQFARLGWEVELWVPRRKNEYKTNEDIYSLYGITPRFPIRIIPAIDTIWLFRTVGFLVLVASFNLSAYIRLRKEENAVVYAHDIRDILLPLLRGLPVFVEIHDFYESSVRALNRFAFSRVTGLIVTNTHKLEQIAKRYHVPRVRMLRQPNAVDAGFFDTPLSQREARLQLGLPETGRIALYTGHLFPWKGVYTLADAAAFLLPDVSILFVGGTPEDRHKLEQYVHAHALPRITFVPHQTLDMIPLYQKAADVLVLPNTALDEASRVETSPVKLFEYLASGRPIVASDIPSIREIVSENEVLFAEPDNGESLARTIVAACSENEERAQAARLLARAHSWESRAANIQQFMEHCLRTRHAHT